MQNKIYANIWNELNWKIVNAYFGKSDINIWGHLYVIHITYVISKHVFVLVWLTYAGRSGLWRLHEGCSSGSERCPASGRGERSAEGRAADRSSSGSSRQSAHKPQSPKVTKVWCFAILNTITNTVNRPKIDWYTPSLHLFAQNHN